MYLKDALLIILNKINMLTLTLKKEELEGRKVFFTSDLH